MRKNETFNCSNGLILPTSIEKNWSIPLRAFLYLIALLYSFVGIAIIADVFMCAIERITSTTRKVRVINNSNEAHEGLSKEKFQYKEVLVWNPTVANLSLMAFGSSAPEILLSIIELMGNNFQVGEIGPGTIVGSAAFNLMVITAICIASIPKGEKKGIEKISVYCVTAFWNVFAYIWLIFILLGTSKDVIEIWEGALTFVFFFILILTAYACDKEMYKICFKKKVKPEVLVVTIPMPPMPISDIEIIITEDTPDHNVISYHPEWRDFETHASMEFPNLPEEGLAKMIALKINEQRPKDYLEHRIDAIRKLSKSSIKGSYSEVSERESEKTSSTLSKIEFAARVYGIDPENEKKVQLKVVRRGAKSKKMSVKYETVNGGAKSNSHFVWKSETLNFDHNENEKLITIELIDAAKWMIGDLFTVKLEPDPMSTKREKNMKLGKCHTIEVIFLGNEFNNFNSTNSEIEFVRHSVNVKFHEGYVRVPVARKGNIKQKITADWITEGVNDKKWSTLEGTMGKVSFEEGEIETYFDIPIDSALIEKNRMFLVKLANPSTNVTIGQTSVTMINNDGIVRVFNKIDTLVPKILRSLEPGKQSWQEQFYQYLNVNGGDTMYASMADYVVHIISFPWKVICAFVPPPIYFGGWLSFILALGLIGVVTAFVLDIAGAFGCLVGLDNTITAITFVALGASLPDTFASRIAAMQDKTADNSVGNVTGSNSVNVFVGLGLPWFIASIYWASKGQKFKVPSGDIGFCVTIYTICAFITLSLLLARRKLKCLGQAELGGPTRIKWTCTIVLVVLWLLYVLISSLQIHGYMNIHF